MSKFKYPQQYKTLINFETCESESVPEGQDERRARLRRAASRRRREAFADTVAINDARWTAVTEAWRRVYEGVEFPIHFDLILVSGRYSQTERYTLVDAAFTKRTDVDGKL